MSEQPPMPSIPSCPGPGPCSSDSPLLPTGAIPVIPSADPVAGPNPSQSIPLAPPQDNPAGTNAVSSQTQMPSPSQWESIGIQPDVFPTILSDSPDELVTQTNQVTATVSPESVSAASSASPAGAIAGGVIGGLALLCIAALFGFLLYRRKRQYRLAPSTEFMRDNAPLARSTSILDSSPPPPFVPNPRYEHPFKEKMPI